MIIRKYESADCEKMAELFYNTVHTVNAKDYTEEQLNVWATGQVDLERWNQSFLEHFTVVAVCSERTEAGEDGNETGDNGNRRGNTTIVGFGDMDDTGYLDRLYVHKDYQGIGIATAICDALEQQTNAAEITTHASITARPFFEKRGYRVVKEQQVERGGILLTNYVMISDRSQ